MFKSIICIVPHNQGEFINEAALQAGASGGSIIMGRGTASNSVLQLLGLGDTSKDITYNIVDNQIEEKVRTAIYNAAQTKKTHFGVMFSLYVNTFIRSGNNSKNSDSKGAENMNKNEYEMLNIIVNKGYAEDAMAAARKAGAGGGTIINARGTAKEGDAKFFGINIVPEKEMLIILAPSDKKDDIINAIKSLPCFSEAGSGIIFCSEVQDFTLLGKN